MAVTIRMVAEHCGMAVSSTADILRDRGHLYAEASRLKVLGAARELGYCPNASARAVRRGRANVYSLVVGASDEDSFLPLGLLAGLGKTLAAHQQHLAIRYLSRGDEPGRVRETVTGLMSDGFFVNYMCALPDGLREIIHKNRLPCIHLNRREPHNAVHPDDAGDLYRATGRLLAAGHRDIAYFDPGRPLEPVSHFHYSRTDRLNGYRAAMAEAGLPPRVWGFWADVSASETPEQVRGLLAGSHRPTAVVTYSWLAGVSVLSVARMLGLTPPRDLAVATVYANDESIDHGFALSLHLDWPAVARAAVDMQHALSGRLRRSGTEEVASVAVSGFLEGTPPPPFGRLA